MLEKLLNLLIAIYHIISLKDSSFGYYLDKDPLQDTFQFIRYGFKRHIYDARNASPRSRSQKDAICRLNERTRSGVIKKRRRLLPREDDFERRTEAKEGKSHRQAAKLIGANGRHKHQSLTHPIWITKVRRIGSLWVVRRTRV